MNNWINVIAILISAAVILGACSGNLDQAEGEAPEAAENPADELPPSSGKQRGVS